MRLKTERDKLGWKARVLRIKSRLSVDEWKPLHLNPVEERKRALYMSREFRVIQWQLNSKYMGGGAWE